KPRNEVLQVLGKPLQLGGERHLHGRPPGLVACHEFWSAERRWRGLATRSLSTTFARVAATTSSIRSSSDPSRIARASSTSFATPSVDRRSAWACACCPPSATSRSICATTLAATRVRRRSRPSATGITSRSRNSRTASASSPVVGMPCAMSRASQPTLEQQQHVVLLLPYAATDRRQLDRALVAREMPPRLVHAAAAPPDRAEDLPVAHDLGVDAATSDALVAAEEVL